MARLMGVVVQVVGEVFALASDGARRLLAEGERVYSGERLQTGAGGAVSVNLPGGQQLVLGRDSEIVLSEQLLSGMPVARPVNDQPTLASDADLSDVSPKTWRNIMVKRCMTTSPGWRLVSLIGLMCPALEMLGQA